MCTSNGTDFLIWTLVLLENDSFPLYLSGSHHISCLRLTSTNTNISSCSVEWQLICEVSVVGTQKMKYLSGTCEFKGSWQLTDSSNFE